MPAPELQSLVPWSSKDAENLQFFLSTDTGRRLLPKVAESVPQLLESGDSNAILIRNGKFKGFQEALNEIFRLAHPSPEVTANPNGAYPSLEDDAAWNDGQTLTKTETK
jgi:hypothetical protein